MSGYYAQQVEKNLRAAEDELARHRQAQARVRELHKDFRSATGEVWCEHCNESLSWFAIPWPCPTLISLEVAP